jgi:hypothetical protein
MKPFLVYVNGLEYQVQASTVTRAIFLAINDGYLEGADIPDQNEKKAYFIVNRRKGFNKKQDRNRQDEGSFNVRVWVKRIG